MKRPLCFLCLVFIVLLTIGTWLVPLSVPDNSDWNGQWMTLEGQVYQKEYRKKQSESGSAETLVIYLKSVHIIANQNHSDKDRSETHISNADIPNIYNLNQSSLNPNGSGRKKSGERTAARQIQGVVCYMEKPETVEGKTSETKAAERKTIEPAIGNTVRLRGKVRCFSRAGNPGEFDMQRYSCIKKQDFQLRDAELLALGGKTDRLREGLFEVKSYFSSVIDKIYDEKEASIMKAMLLGEKNELDEYTKELYQRSAILHILSISGLHISMIGMGIYHFLQRIGLPVKVCGITAAFMITVYGIMTGMSLSAARAILMFLLHLTADMLGRSYDMITALSLAAVLLLIEQPRYVEQSGFLFSFGAVAGIGVLQPALCPRKKGKKTEADKKAGRYLKKHNGKADSIRKYIENRKIGERIKQSFSVSLAVSLVTLPIQLRFYYEFPFYSLFLNMIVIPLMTAVMGAGILVMMAGGIAVFPATLAAAADRVILWFYEKCCIICEQIPFGLYTGGMPADWQTAVYFALLLVLAGVGKKLPLVWKSLWIAAACLILLYRPVGDLRITVLDVGQGDCIHIESASGKHYLIDGGSTSKNETAKYQIIPYLKSKGVRRLEAIFVSHSDADHCNAVKAMLEGKEENRMEVGTLILPDIAEEYKDEGYAELVRLASEQEIPVQYMSRGECLSDGELKLLSVHPAMDYGAENSNEYSLVLYLTYGKFSALFTGDVEGAGEQEMLAYMERYTGKKGKKHMRLTLLKVAHHGSENSTGREMLEAFSPGISVISCGRNNRYGHPHVALLERLQEAGSKVYITAEKGAVTVWTNGREYRAESYW